MKPGILIAVALSILGIATVQKRVANACAKAKETDEVYLLPPPDELKAMSLGYRSAVADLMWANVLVTQGFRLTERRHYDTIVAMLDGITSLDPQFREPYLYSDALITFQSVPTTHDDTVAARRILELGVKNRPLDADLWLNLGTFVCFLAPSSLLDDPAEQAAWREQGAAYLERAVELSGADSNVAWNALGGGVRFERMGERDAAIRFYRKVLEATDDEDLRAKARERLDAMLAEESRVGRSDIEALRETKASEERKRLAAIEVLHPELREQRRRSYPGLSLDMMLVGGPAPDPWRCAGLDQCPQSWRDWASQRVEALGLEKVPPP